MAKFKVGDRVISIKPVSDKEVTGVIGTIVGIDKWDNYKPYLVKFDQDIDERHICARQGGWWCHEDDIELVKENNMFTKKDLKNGDVVKMDRDAVGIVCVDTGTITFKGGFDRLGSYTDDLIHECGAKIMAVRRPRVPGDCQFCAFEHDFGTLVYERKEVEEMTLEEVCKALGKDIKIVKK